MGWTLLCCVVNQERQSKKRPPIAVTETVLDFSRCNLIEVPNEFDHDPDALLEVDLSYNKIEELDPILMRCRNVQSLNLSDNQLRSINDQLASAFKNLITLNLAHNRFESVPTIVGSLEYLQSLDLSNNNIGKILDGTITEVLTLKELRLNSCGLNFLPANIAKLTNLESLELRENNLEALPLTIKLLTKLKLLDLGRNNIEELQPEVGYLFNLQELILDENILSDVSVVGELLNLRHLDLSANNLMAFPDEICNCLQLETLYGDGNEFEQLPEAIGNLTQLTRLNMNYVGLKALPTSIGYLQSLEELNLYENYFEYLPSTIGFLRNLQILVAYDNRLKELPNELASCTKLTHLNVANNKLSRLPDNIGYLKNLRSLSLIGNYLMYLPISLSMIQNLEGLWLSPYQEGMRKPNLSRVESEGGFVLTSPLLEQNYKPSNYNEQPDSIGSTKGQTKIQFSVDDVDAQKADDDHPHLKSPEQPQQIFRIPTPTQRERKRLEKFAKTINAERTEVAKNFEIKEARVASTSTSTAAYTNTPRQRRSLDPEYIELSSSEFRPLCRPPPPYEIASKYSKMSQSELDNFQKLNNSSTSYSAPSQIPLLSATARSDEMVQ
jgi:Leucine-rich repeat (LRR) protein